ncbi:MAG: PapB/FocB family fimbrial expression transcriptional regulator [Acinetobacter sp.]
MNTHNTEIMKRENQTLIYEGLVPGKVSLRYFRLLLSISTVKSIKMQGALEDIFVKGYSRKAACLNHQVSPGNLSTRLRHLQFVAMTIYMMSQYKN